MTANGKPALAATLKAAILQAEIASAQRDALAETVGELLRIVGMLKSQVGFLYPADQIDCRSVINRARAELAEMGK
jgi:hypothetical protein